MEGECGGRVWRERVEGERGGGEGERGRRDVNCCQCLIVVYRSYWFVQVQVPR